VREHARVKHYSRRIEQAYVGWIKRYILFHDKRHPRDMEKRAMEACPCVLAVERNVNAAMQTQALSALLFLYRDVI
ncbi:MAG: phage integrase N-terminal SAM-like domain-containing protein, partial [Zoogloea sp.]|nr:phage integrase N-terminal SAM-like domain-containing protein [Zoogloea sp.]